MEATLRELASITEPTLRRQRIAATIGDTGTVLPALLGLLNTDDPQLRGGLGEIAARLERDQVVSALRAVARSRQHPLPARLSAVTILDRYLGEQIDESLWDEAYDPQEVALRSLRELIAAMAQDERAVLEYLAQLAEQPAETAWMILNAIPELMPDPHLITALRVLAQGGDGRLAQAALEQLGRVRTPEALRALLSLTANLPPQLAALAERGARKLRMSGVSLPAETALTWHTVLTPVDGAGAQILQFTGRVEGAVTGRALLLILADPGGIVFAAGAAEAPITEWSPLQQRELQQVAPAIMWLEVPFAVGLQTLREALALHWASGRLLPADYRLFNVWLWGEGLPALPDEVEAETAPDEGGTAPDIAALFDHAAFSDWFWLTPEVEAVAESWRRSLPTKAKREEQITALAQAQFTPEVLASYQRRLRRQARWLTLAGADELARVARSVATGLATTPPAASLFVRRLIDVGLTVATRRPLQWIVRQGASHPKRPGSHQQKEN